MSRPPLRPDRLPRIERGFATIPNRFLHGGFFASLGRVERSLYFFLVLAADRNGVSFYGYDRICAALGVRPDEYLQARDRLVDADLVAFEGGCFQILSLPPRPRQTTSTMPGRRASPGARPAPTKAGWCRDDLVRLDEILRALQKP